jgi:hypothetical protein
VIFEDTVMAVNGEVAGGTGFLWGAFKIRLPGRSAALRAAATSAIQDIPSIFPT